MQNIAGDAAGGPFGAAGPAMFGPGAVAAPADEDEHSLTWTSGMARSRQALIDLECLCHNGGQREQACS
jgi:hypothetical protein